MNKNQARLVTAQKPHLPSPSGKALQPLSSERQQTFKHHDLLVCLSPVDALKPYKNNARTHSRMQVRQIADSIRAFGFVNPVLLDKTGTIIAGHGRVEAAKLLGIEHVPTIALADLTEDEVRAYILADNRLAEKAGWDDAILKIELQHLMTLEIGLDVTITGFEVGEIDLILKDNDDSDPEEQAIEEVGPPTSQAGDLWCLGKHRLLCGSALDLDSYTQLMNGKLAHVSSRILPTTSRSMATSAEMGRSNMKSSPWPPAR